MNKKLLICIATVAIIGIGTAGARFGYMFNTIKQYDQVIYPKVYVEDIDLSGKTKEEAEKLLSERYGQEVVKKKINISSEGRTYSIDYSKLNGRYDIEEAVKRSFDYGRDSNILSRYGLINKPKQKEIELNFSYDSKPIKELIANIQKEVDKSPADARIKEASKGTFSVTPDIKGAKLNTDKLEKDISAVINGDLSGDIEIKAEIYVVEAAVTAETLSKINSKIASFSTNFAGSSANRISNISLATRSISGKVLMPGDSFSFNDVVGQRTVQKGYKEAPVIINSKLDSGIGGGICQVSTTLFNAVIRSNIDATERTHHSLPSHYIGLGMDATVDYGNLDYKFKNTLEYPIYIEGYLSDKNLIFNIYSDRSLTKNTYDLVSETYDTTKADIKYIDDSNMFEGETEIVEKASDGYKVRVYKKIYENGKLVGQEVISNETYKKINGVVKRGTKKKPIQPAKPTEQAPPAAPTEPATPTEQAVPATPTE